MKTIIRSGSKTLLIAVGMLALVMGGALLAQEARPETDVPSPVTLNAAGGSEIGFVYEAFLSPQQEGGEEADTPGLIPPQFRSTTPSVNRNERPSRGHAILQFPKDLSKAYVYLAIDGVNVAEINMLHLHCGRPGQLGPIIVDFSVAGNINTYLEDNMLAIEITNEDIVAVTDHGSHSPVDAFTKGCPINLANPTDKVKTIAGLQLIAQQGEIYFNLHTTGQTYFGDMRGQFYPISEPSNR